MALRSRFNEYLQQGQRRYRTGKGRSGTVFD